MPDTTTRPSFLTSHTETTGSTLHKIKSVFSWKNTDISMALQVQRRTCPDPYPLPFLFSCRLAPFCGDKLLSLNLSAYSVVAPVAFAATVA